VNLDGHFFYYALAAGGFSALYFSVPGLAVSALVGGRGCWPGPLRWMIAPALGLVVFGPFSLACSSLFGYSQATLWTTWAGFSLPMAMWGRSSGPDREAGRLRPRLTSGGWWLLAGILVFSMVPTLAIHPILHHDGVFVGPQLLDHGKTAMVAAMAREGLPPVNPYYAPDGEKIGLIYYYGWHFLASQPVLLTGITAWQADLALTWLTCAASAGFLCSLAVRLGGRLAAGWVTLALLTTGPPYYVLRFVLGPRGSNWVNKPDGHPLELFWEQIGWVPQHVASALAIVVLLFLMARVLKEAKPKLHSILFLGLTAASAFNSSVWVGGVALALSVPALLIALLGLRLDRRAYLAGLKTGAAALAVAVLFMLPVLQSITSGPSVIDRPFPFRIELWTATRLISKDSGVWGVALHALLYWIQFLPLNLGIVYLLGLPSMLARRPSTGEERIFLALGIAATLAFLLVAQLLASSIYNNDLGWRAVLPPIMLMSVWAATALVDLGSCRAVGAGLPGWGSRSLLARFPRAFLHMSVAALTVGLLAAAAVWRWPVAEYLKHDRPALRRALVAQEQGWERIRLLTDPEDLVQDNPDSPYQTLFRVPITALLADRATAYAGREWVEVYAYTYDRDTMQRQYETVRSVFGSDVTKERLLVLRDRLRVKALLVTTADPVFRSKEIDRSGVYELAESAPGYKIYLAISRSIIPSSEDREQALP
jgi:hypothetical protein